MCIFCHKLCLWNAKKEDLCKPVGKRFTPLLLYQSSDKEHCTFLTNMCLCALLYCVQMPSICTYLCTETEQTLGWRCLLCFQVCYRMRCWWNQCCLLTKCKLGRKVKRPKLAVCFLVYLIALLSTAWVIDFQCWQQDG